MIESISAITLATHDMVRSVGFYRGLGFRLRYGGEDADFTSFTVGTGYLNVIAQPADRLGQRCGGVRRRDQHDVLDAARGEKIAQGGRVRVVRPRHADRLQMMPTRGGAFLRA